MYELLSKVFEALGGYPLIQAAVAILVFLVGIGLMRRGEKDRKAAENGNGQPNWTLYGPIHDVIGAIHELNEQSRRQVDLLERIEDVLRQSSDISRMNMQLLEVIRNESRLR